VNAGWPSAAATVISLLFATTACNSDTSFDRDLIEDATVRVRADGCGPRTELGTGTAIADGLVVTAAHVVAGSERVEVVNGSGATIDAEVVVFDPDLDIAALRPVSDAGPPASLRSEPAREGDVGVIGLISADGSVGLVEVDVMQRVAIRTTDITLRNDVERPGLRVDVAVEPGDSGAMVHLPGGGVGIIWSRSTATAEQAWTVDVPPELIDASTRRALVDPVDVGPCL
jgi:S1-C subfamily serine protease